MGVGVVLVLAALSLFLWNWHEARQAENAAEQVLPQLIQKIECQPQSDLYDPAMTEVEIDGYQYIGYLMIPSLELQLPVMSEWDYTRLRIAPCRYTGSTKTDDLVIAAHNYARHFGRLSKLVPGDPVYFMDMDGILSSYEVVEVNVLNPTAVEEMTSGEYDLTLFTCTYGGQSRVTVRCNHVTEESE